MALPYLNLYIGDIMKDTDVLSPAAFGGYVRLLFKLHAATPRGEVCFTLPQLCRVFAAGTLEETVEILREITDPAHNICDYFKKDDRHYFTNRRMKKETAKSMVRSEAGKLGAAKTNAKNKQNKLAAEKFAVATRMASATTKDASDALSNDDQNYNNNIGNNSDSKIKETAEEFFEDKLWVVPEMLIVWKQYKPKYISQQEKDFPALRKIAELIAEQENVEMNKPAGVEKIKTVWSGIIAFIQTDKLFKDYQINQVEKYFQAITSKYISSQENGVQEKSVKKSTIQNNVDAAQQARDILNRKYANT